MARYWLQHGVSPPENRGGDRRSNATKPQKEKIRQHIETFSCKASHYARRGAPGRKYLPCELSVKKMHEMFEQQNHEQVTYGLYYSVFVYDFNLGFGNPAKDMCGTCMQLKMKLKDNELSQEQRRQVLGELICHKQTAQKFYKELNNLQGALTLCFDVMENLVLPKTSVGQAFYSRQLYMYVFGIVIHRGENQGQDKDDVNLYWWTENQNKKDSNMISSALLHCIKNAVGAEPEKLKRLRLFSDGCYGQNKNISVMSMLFSLRKELLRNAKIEYFFPVRGHSFLPADRVFGRLEQSIRKKDPILHPTEYVEIMSQHGKTYEYGKDFTCFDFKSEAKKHCKQARSYKLSKAKVCEINGDLLGIKTTYYGETTAHSVLKRGRKWSTFNPQECEQVNCVKQAKRNDVMKLLKAIGASEAATTYYVDAFRNTEDRDVINTDTDDSSDDEIES